MDRMIIVDSLGRDKILVEGIEVTDMVRKKYIYIDGKFISIDEIENIEEIQDAS